MRAERYGVALDVCKKLRTHGVEDPELLETEMFILERYAPNEALERLREEVLKRPDDRLLQLRLSMLGLRLNRADVIVSAVEKLPAPTEVSPRDAILAVNILRSQGIVDLFGQHGAESILLASEPGSVLWTDDLTVAGYAKEFGSVKRIWTQLMLQHLKLQGRFEEDGYIEATAKLAGWGYFFTSITANSVLAAGRMANWNPGKWPLKQTVDYFHVESIAQIEIVNLTNELIVRIYREALPPETSNSLTVRLLENLSRRKDGREIILAIRRAVPRIFGLDVLGATNAARTINAWLAAKLR